MSDQTGDLHFVVDGKGIIRYANPAASYELQRETEDLLGRPVSDIEPDSSEQRIQEMFARVDSSDEVRFKSQLRRKDNSQLAVDVSVTAIEAENEPMLFAAARNIERQKQFERELELYKTAISATDNGVTIADATQPDLPIIHANAGFYKMTGYNAEEVLGHNCRFLQGADTQPELVTKITSALAAGERARVLIKNYRKDGSLLWNDLILNPVHDESGTLTHYIGVQNDVTEFIRTRELEASRALQLTTIMDSTGEGIFGVDQDGRFTFVNGGGSENARFLKPRHHARKVDARYAAPETRERSGVRRPSVQPGQRRCRY